MCQGAKWLLTSLKGLCHKKNPDCFIHTLTGHFIRHTLLVPGWTPICLQNCLNSSWHIFNKVLETLLRDVGHIDMIASRSCCRFVGCTSMIRISRSTTSQRCSIGLRSGDCGGHLSKVNSLSCSRNLFKIINVFKIHYQESSQAFNSNYY